jgi:hypothetical protein
MWLFEGRPCKQMIKYDGRSLDLTGLGLNLPLGAPLNFNLAELHTKPDLLQAAAEIAQLLDAAQFANCTQISLVKDDTERVKLVNQSIQNQDQLVKFALVMKLVSSNPTSAAIQNALAAWIAAQTTRVSDLSNQVQVQTRSAARGAEQQISAPSEEQIQSTIEKAKRAEPSLTETIQRGATLDLNKIIEAA